MDKEDYILASISDAVGDICYYDRKGCEEVNRDEMDELIKSGQLTLENMVDAFRNAVLEQYPNIK